MGMAAQRCKCARRGRLNTPSPTTNRTATVALKPLCAELLGYAPPSSSSGGNNEGNASATSPSKGPKRPMENPFRTVLHVVDAIAARLSRWVLVGVVVVAADEWMCMCVWRCFGASHVLNPTLGTWHGLCVVVVVLTAHRDCRGGGAGGLKKRKGGAEGEEEVEPYTIKRLKAVVRLGGRVRGLNMW